MIKILIVDDQNFTRQALQAILETEADFEVVGKATNGMEALKYLEQSQVDIIIVDLEMPQMNGLTVTQRIKERFPLTKVIILSSHDDKKSINAAVEAGAKGYLLKSTSAQEIVDTIRAIQRGYFQLGPGLFEKLLSHLIQEKEQATQNLSELENKYAESMTKLEEKILSRNEGQRQELYREIELQIENLKQDFRSGLENFQYQVGNQLQSGLEDANNKFNKSIPSMHNIETKIDRRNIEQQRYINTLFVGNKQNLYKLEKQINSLRHFLIFLAVIVLIVCIFIVF